MLGTMLLLTAFGQVFGGLLKKAAEKHVENFFASSFESIGAFGKKDAVTKALEAAYAAWFEVVLTNVKALGYDETELQSYRTSGEQLLSDPSVAQELLKPFLDPTGQDRPDFTILRDAWRNAGGEHLPAAFP